MDHYWKNIATPPAFLPSLLDPHMKNLSFVSATSQFAAEESLHEKFDEMKAEMHQELNNITSSHVNSQ